MKKNNKKNSSADISKTWFSLSGNDDDVVLSTRTRLCRNLADFVFPVKMSQEDMERINSLVYDAVSGDETCHFINYKNIFSQGRQILTDKNVIPEGQNFDCTAVVLFDDDASSILVNNCDHVKIAAFSSGLEVEKTMEMAYKIDELLQNKLQFAASHDFGYLTSKIKDCGTGLKISVRIFIPGIILTGKFDSIISLIQEKNFLINPVFSVAAIDDFSNFIFEIQPGSAASGTELDQAASINAVVSIILKTERKIQQEFADNNHTIILNYVKRAYAKAMYSLLLTYEDTVDIISVMKFGLHCGIVQGISESELNSLYYRTKHGHIVYVNDNYAFSYEEDLKKDRSAQLQRLRAIVIQQAFENLKLE